MSWEDKFSEMPGTFQLRLGTGVCRFPKAGLGFRTGRVYLVQDVYVPRKRRVPEWKKRRTLFR